MKPLLILILTLLVSCAPPPEQLASRYETLSREGRPERIVEEFERDELVRQATLLFPYQARYKNLHLHSDRSLQESDAVPILMEAYGRLSDSPIFNPQLAIHAFICNDSWKEEIFMGGLGKIGGRAYIWTAPHVFFTNADVPNDALLSPAGRPIAPPRTFTYYLTHEFSHVMIGRYLGEEAYEKIPTWVSEGYPDFVALGPGYTAAQAQKAYQQRDPRTHGTMAEDYLRYGLMVATFLETDSVDTMLEAPPEESDLWPLFKDSQR